MTGFAFPAEWPKNWEVLVKMKFMLVIVGTQAVKMNNKLNLNQL